MRSAVHAYGGPLTCPPFLAWPRGAGAEPGRLARQVGQYVLKDRATKKAKRDWDAAQHRIKTTGLARLGHGQGATGTGTGSLKELAGE